MTASGSRPAPGTSETARTDLAQLEQAEFARRAARNAAQGSVDHLRLGHLPDLLARSVARAADARSRRRPDPDFARDRPGVAPPRSASRAPAGRRRRRPARADEWTPDHADRRRGRGRGAARPTSACVVAARLARPPGTRAGDRPAARQQSGLPQRHRGDVPRRRPDRISSRSARREPTTLSWRWRREPASRCCRNPRRRTTS
jgi:hypothetical protein